MCIVGSKKSKIGTSQEKSGQSYRRRRQGRLNVVGIGPGEKDLISPKALEAMKKSEVIVGYKTYIKLLGDLISSKEVISSAMAQEAKRAGIAIGMALKGRQVSLISSGDPGVYGMAGLVLELLSEEERDKIEIEIIPGIIAATSCAALLGAPLMHDFAVISLSDILTDLKLIERRVAMAARGDFVIVFYNPQAKNRTRPIRAAWKILAKYKSSNTPVGIVRNAQRDNQEVAITTLERAPSLDNIDMVTTIIVGNSKTYVKGKDMITPRGYELRQTPRRP